MKKLLAVILSALMMLTVIPVLAGGVEQKTITLAMGSGKLRDEWIALFEELNPDIKVEVVNTETATIEQVLKTGIAAGDPVDTARYWGTRVNSFYDIGMCLDLSEYLNADPEWRDSILPAMYESVTGENGEIWAVPSTAVYHVVYYNKDMMDQYGFEEPETWEEMTEIFARLKEDDIFGFTVNSVSMQDCIYGLAYTLLEQIEPGTAWKAANGDLQFEGTEVGAALTEVLELVKGWYDAGYWYPGESSINTSADDANAAFSQGRTMFIFNYSGALGIHERSCDFEIGAFMKPVKEAGMTSYENMETDVQFIPSNVPPENIEPALRLIKFMTSAEAQQIVVNNGTLPVTTYDLEMSDTLKEVLSFSENNVIPGVNPCRLSSEMQTFIKQEFFSGVCGGMRTIQETLAEMDRIRLNK